VKKNKENYGKIVSRKDTKKVLSFTVVRVGLEISYSLRQYLRVVSEIHSGSNFFRRGQVCNGKSNTQRRAFKKQVVVVVGIRLSCHYTTILLACYSIPLHLGNLILAFNLHYS